MRMRAFVIATVVVLALAATGCVSKPPSIDFGGASGAGAGSTTGRPSVPGTPSAPSTGLVPAAASSPSATSLQYAAALGGTPHRGEKLFVVVGLVTKTEEAAAKALDAALPVFGDMQTYFIVQRSDNFAGMAPGSWVLIEAYRTRENAEREIELGRRAFANAYVKQVTVRTADPIPVYEDMVPE